jgi:hypothetical protein
MVSVEAGAGGSIFRLGEGEVVLVVDVEVLLLLGVLETEGLEVVPAAVVAEAVVEGVTAVSPVVLEPLLDSPRVPEVSLGAAVWAPAVDSITWPIEGWASGSTGVPKV